MRQRSPRHGHMVKLAVLLMLSAGGPFHAQGQLPAGTEDATQIPKTDPRRAQVAQALDRQDFPTALKLLTDLTLENPKDARLLYDRGYTQESMDQIEAAATSYRAAAAADPTFFEPHLALGLLLARAGKMTEAHSELLNAVKLNPSTEPAFKGRAWRALARIDEQDNPALARDELLNALKTSPEQPEDMLMSAELAERLGDLPAAEAAYRDLLKKQSGDPEATAALAQLLVKTKRSSEAEPLLVAAVANEPKDVALSSELANVYAADGKTDQAVSLIEKLRSTQPNDPTLARLYAGLLTQKGDYEKAEPVWAQLTRTYPNDPVLLDDRADALIHLKQFAQAESILKRAVAQPTAFPTKEDLGDAASHLAFAASESKDPETTLQALQLRATVLPPSPSTLYLAATANDQLHRVKEASELYRQFLSSANGKFPDEEWQARHRLITLEHMK